VHRRRESASLPKKEGITSVGGMSTMANPNDPAENLKWFYEHCASHHYLLETAMPMLDVAVFILHYIKNLDILFVSNQVKADLARSIVNFTKTQCSEKHLLVYVESITLMLLDLMADENFQHDKLLQYASIMATAGASVATPLLSGDEQNTPLTSNVSAPLSLMLLSHQTQKAESSIQQLSSIQEEPPDPDGCGGVVGHIDKHVKVGDIIEEPVKVGASLSVAPVNLDKKFAAATSPDKSRLDSEDEDNECVLIDGPPNSPEAPNRSLSKYSLSEAWTKNNLTTSHSKFSGTSTSWHQFLQPELHCKQCSFPHSATIIFIGDQAYFNKCTNTTVWLDGDFIEGFATLSYHYSHSSGMPTATNRDLPQLVHVTHPKQTLAANNVKPLPSLVLRLVGILHNLQHYVVLEVHIAERTILIYDGLSRDLLQWTDHIVTVFKKCMLLDLSFDVSSAVIVPDAPSAPFASRSRRPKPIINGYSITFPMKHASDSGTGNWRLERGQFIHQTDGFNCGPIACLKLMDLFDKISLPYPQAFYETTNIRKVVMDEWKNLVEYCHNSNVPLFYKEKHVQDSMQDGSTEKTDENGINFAPLCTPACLGKYSGCVHEKKKVQINTLGQYVLFPSKWYHQGYYNDRTGMVFVTAQLFARPSISPDSMISLRSIHSKDQMIEGWLGDEAVSVLGTDILVNWNTTYSLQYFQPCKDFYGPVDMEFNRQIPSTKFEQVPLIKKLVDQFCTLFPHLSIDQVWLIVKSKRGSGFQEWHRDFYLNDKIVRTIVVNLGAMKRSDVPGEAFHHLREIPPSEPAVPSDQKSPPETISVTSDLKCPPETIIPVTSDRKRPPETAITVPSDLKSPPVNMTITKKEDKDSQELEEDFVEYNNEREDNSEEQEDLVESHNERDDIHEESKRATNQESLFTFVPSIPPFPKRTVWICDKCDTEQSEDKRRCGTCKSWKGGKRGAMKMMKPTKKDTATPKISAAGRKKKNTPPPTALLNVAACSSLSIEGDDLFSPLTVTGPEMNDSFEESTYDWENASSIGEDTVARESNDERIKLLQDQDENEVGDGGDSDGEGDGYECVTSFRLGMKEVERERLEYDAQEIEHDVEVDDDDACVCEETNDVQCTLFGAPKGWSPPGQPEDWNPRVNSSRGEPPMDDVDNPGGWSSFTYRPMFQAKGGRYIGHAMPAGATAVPISEETGKRESEGFEFFYNGWKQENPTRDNCRFGATRDNLFPPDRQVQLDINYLKKMGLTKQRMVECDALFFYQLLLPICDPAMSGINDDPRMTYYEKVATNTNMYAYGVKKRGTRGHIFKPADACELLVWDGIVCRNLNNNIAESWMMNQSNTFDREISEAMH